MIVTLLSGFDALSIPSPELLFVKAMTKPQPVPIIFLNGTLFSANRKISMFLRNYTHRT